MTEIKVDDCFKEDDGSTFRVMAIADNYAMCRRLRCYPFIRGVKELLLMLANGSLTRVNRVVSAAKAEVKG